MPTLLTIRETAKRGILSEHALRTRLKEGKLPGIYTGTRFLIDVDELVAQIKTECRANLKEVPDEL